MNIPYHIIISLTSLASSHLAVVTGHNLICPTFLQTVDTKTWGAVVSPTKYMCILLKSMHCIVTCYFLIKKNKLNLYIDSPCSLNKRLRLLVKNPDVLLHKFQRWNPCTSPGVLCWVAGWWKNANFHTGDKPKKIHGIWHGTKALSIQGGPRM